jgi:superfamily II DNA or RNA helicase
MNIAPTTLKLHQRSCVAAALALEYGPGQFCYPTGTGKTLAEAHVIVEHIRAGDTGVYVVLAPRIMLAQQLFTELYNELVIRSDIDCAFFSLHSGKSPNIRKMTQKMRLTETFDDQDDSEDSLAVYNGLRNLGLTDAQLREVFPSSTKTSALREAIETAEADGRPLVIVSTYHSAQRLSDALEDDENPRELSILIADEGHNAVAVGFKHVHDIPATKRLYFTATRKLTDGGEDGDGMQNTSTFGPVLDALSPAEAVVRGLIVRPRVHYVEIEGVNDENELDADFKAIEAAFVSHAKAVGGIGAKLLVAARGTLEIQQIVDHSDYFKRLRTVRPNLKVFDITSAYGARVNGAVVDREQFLSRLQSLKDSDEAIILHYDILSEGIDVPGITGVMPLRALGTSKFLQTLGRATRLHSTDRAMIGADEELAIENAAKLDWMVKPCAWLVLPCYGSYGGEIQASAEVYVRQLRTFGWIPGENDLLTEAGGENEPTPIEDIHPEDKRLPPMVEAMGELNQRFEDREAMVKAYEMVVVTTDDEVSILL